MLLLKDEKPPTFVKLTFSRTTKKKPQWEYTYEFYEATTFTSEDEATDRKITHGCRIARVSPRDYEAAHRIWTQAQLCPQKKEQQLEL